jgi:fumarate reductase subunit C
MYKLNVLLIFGKLNLKGSECTYNMFCSFKITPVMMSLNFIAIIFLLGVLKKNHLLADC